MKRKGHAIIPVGRAIDGPALNQLAAPPGKMQQRMVRAEWQIVNVAQLQVLGRVVRGQRPVVEEVQQVLVSVRARVIVKLLGDFIIGDERQTERCVLLNTQKPGVALVTARGIMAEKFEALVLREG